MIRCTRCGRAMKQESPTGMGPRCTVYVLGQRAKKPANSMHVAGNVHRDDATPDLFSGYPYFLVPA